MNEQARSKKLTGIARRGIMNYGRERLLPNTKMSAIGSKASRLAGLLEPVGLSDRQDLEVRIKNLQHSLANPNLTISVTAILQEKLITLEKIREYEVSL